jgi:hypothetical protein
VRRRVRAGRRAKCVLLLISGVVVAFLGVGANVGSQVEILWKLEDGRDFFFHDILDGILQPAAPAVLVATKCRFLA